MSSVSIGWRLLAAGACGPSLWYPALRTRSLYNLPELGENLVLAGARHLIFLSLMILKINVVQRVFADDCCPVVFEDARHLAYVVRLHRVVVVVRARRSGQVLGHSEAAWTLHELGPGRTLPRGKELPGPVDVYCVLQFQVIWRDEGLFEKRRSILFYLLDRELVSDVLAR